MRASQGHAVNKVLGALGIPTVSSHDTIDVFLAIRINTIEQLAAGALQHAVNNLVGVTGSSLGGAPIHDRVTNLTESTTAVTVLGAGSGQIGHRICSMDMVAALCGMVLLVHRIIRCVSLGIYSDAVREGGGAAVGVCHQALIDVDANLSGINLATLPQLAGSLCRQTGQRMAQAFPNPNRDAGDHITLAQLFIIAGEGDPNIIFRLLSSGLTPAYIKTVGHDHVVQFPAVDGVQVQQHFHRLDIRNVVGSHVHPVDGAGQQSVQSGILRHHMDGGQLLGALHIDMANDLLDVAVLIGDLKDDFVTAVGNGKVGRAENAVGIGRLNQIAIHIDLGGSRVQAHGLGSVVHCCIVGAHEHIVRHIGSNEEGIVAYIGNRAVVQSDLLVIVTDSAGGEYGQLAIIHRIGIVHGDVVNVIGKVAVIVRGDFIRILAKDTEYLKEEVALECTV